MYIYSMYMNVHMYILCIIIALHPHGKSCVQTYTCEELFALVLQVRATTPQNALAATCIQCYTSSVGTLMWYQTWPKYSEIV